MPSKAVIPNEQGGEFSPQEQAHALFCSLPDSLGLLWIAPALSLIKHPCEQSEMDGHPPPSMDRMLAHLYASVLDPARFEDFAADLRLAMNAHLVAVQTDDASHRHRVQHHFFEREHAVIEPDYANDASQNLFFIRGSQKFEQLGVLDGATLFASGELERTAFYQEVLAPLDVHHSMGFCLDYSPSHEILALSVSRDRHRPSFQPEAMELARRLLPHLRNVHQLQQRLQHLESTASVMDRVSYGIWLLDSDGGVIKENAAAQVLRADSHSGIRKSGAALLATWRADRAELQRAIESGICQTAARRSDFLLHDDAGRAWAACALHPLQRNALDVWTPAHQPACILLVHPLAASQAALVPSLRHVFGLTPAEAELAEMLLHQGSLAGCANKLGKSHETLRTQLKALFAKTETHNQAELIRRLVAAGG